METSDGVANMTEEIRQAAPTKHPFLMNASATPKSQGGASFAPIFRTKKGPKSPNPNSWGSQLWGLFRVRKMDPILGPLPRRADAAPL